MTTTLGFTPALYRVLTAVDQGTVRVTRNGALEPSLRDSSDLVKAMLRPGKSDIHRLDALFKAKLIQFSGTMYGLFEGTAWLTDTGTAVLNGPWRVEHERLEARGRRVAEPSTPPASTAPPEETPRTAALRRVRRFVDEFVTRQGLHPEDVYILPTMDREKDEVVNVTLRVSDLKILLDAAGR